MRNDGSSRAQAARQGEVSSRTWARWEAGDQSIPLGALKLFHLLNRDRAGPARVDALSRTVTIGVRKDERRPQTVFVALLASSNASG